jgi:hypothetical protein
LKKEQNSELDEEEENFEEAVRAVNTVITHTRYQCCGSGMFIPYPGS